ncbi:MAG TPA: hypothetical protein VNT33_16910 [Telluria sp.]|nr:hypothetical protein [Telluria sp.]
MGSIAGTVKFQPAPVTETGAYVAARQMYVTGKAVVIKETGADLATGAYTLANLPVAAPQYAVYSSTLPLKFTPSATSGKYIVSPSAFAYLPASGSAPEVDITTTNQSNVNLTLVPFGP